MNHNVKVKVTLTSYDSLTLCRIACLKACFEPASKVYCMAQSCPLMNERLVTESGGMQMLKLSMMINCLLASIVNWVEKGELNRSHELNYVFYCFSAHWFGIVAMQPNMTVTHEVKTRSHMTSVRS